MATLDLKIAGIRPGSLLPHESTAGEHADIGHLRNQQKMYDCLKAAADMLDRADNLVKRADRIEKRRRDEAGDMEYDPAAAKPLAARS
jgi:hypothetical protein